MPETTDPTPEVEEAPRPDASGSIARTRSSVPTKPEWWHDRYEGSTLQDFVRTLSKVDFGTEVILFGSAILLSVVPIIILLSSLASTRIDDDVARNMGLDRRGAQYVARLFTAPRSASAIEIVISLGMALAGTIAVGLSVQQVYEKIFDQQHVKSVRNLVRCIVWVVCVALCSSPTPRPTGALSMRLSARY